MSNSSVTHLIDDSDKRWRVVVELRRRQVAIVAEIPKDATIDEIVLFTENVRQSMRRKLAELAELAAQKGEHHGQTEGEGKGAVPGADAPGKGEEEGDPSAGGPQGGSNPPPAT